MWSVLEQCGNCGSRAHIYNLKGGSTVQTTEYTDHVSARIWTNRMLEICLVSVRLSLQMNPPTYVTAHQPENSTLGAFGKLGYTLPGGGVLPQGACVALLSRSIKSREYKGRFPEWNEIERHTSRKKPREFEREREQDREAERIRRGG
jgi:hypothetical protein